MGGPRLEPGEVVTAIVVDPTAHGGTGPVGKARPVILVAPKHRRDDLWLALGMTTCPTYSDGLARVAIPGWQRTGVSRPGFLWSRRPISLAAQDIGCHIGWVTDEVVDVIAAVTELGLRVVEEMRPQAREDRRRFARSG